METLFRSNIESIIISILGDHCLQASKLFLECANHQLTRIFVQETDLNPSKNLCLTFSSHNSNGTIYNRYIVPGTNSFARKLDVNLYVNHNWNPITIYWKSKSGNNFYRLCSADIDPDDIVFWFEKLDTALYYQQLYPNDKLPFKLKDLNYQLEVIRLNMDCTLGLKLKPDNESRAEEIAIDIGNFIEGYNIASEKNDRKHGVVHNSKYHIPEADILIYELDLGSAGFHFFKKLLQYLSKQAVFEKVIVE